MTEMEKLVEYLDKSGANYERIKETNIVAFPGGNEIDLGRNQVVVYDNEGCFKWDAICHYGSYGYEQGLLEIMGDIVDEREDGDSVADWLTAEDVIKRVEEQEVQHDVCELRQKVWSEKDLSESNSLTDELTEAEIDRIVAEFFERTNIEQEKGEGNDNDIRTSDR